MAMSLSTREDGMVVTRRRVAPGEIELTAVALLQVIASLAMFFAPHRLLAGNGTALLTLASHGDTASTIAKTIWGIIFLIVGFMAVVAIKEPREDTRRVAWQWVIPLWVAWFAGLCYPIFVGLPTNIILIAAVGVLIVQWTVTRFLVPLDSPWYSREVPLAVERQGEGR